MHPFVSANPPCIVKKKWSEDLTLSKLKDMTGIFMGKPFTNYVPPKTYIFVPTTCPMLKTYGNVFVSGSDKHAEDWMMEKCGRPTSFYLTSAPCPDCAMMLRNKYKDEEESPTIYIARPYIGKGKTGKGSKDVNMQCLAMLVQAGFKLLPWNWRKFPQYINNNECKKAIERMYAGTIKSMSTYNERFEETKSALKEVKEMANSMTDINYTTNCRNALKG